MTAAVKTARVCHSHNGSLSQDSAVSKGEKEGEGDAQEVICRPNGPLV